MSGWYARRGKRALDVIAAIVCLLVLIPLFLVVSCLIYLEDRGIILFRQRRIGRNGCAFELLKFRSMSVDAADLPSHRASSLRVTRIGRFIRRTNIDELPQLVNILVGNMSLVGPRPALESQVLLLQARRENGAMGVRPGLTGLAQVSSYDGMSAGEKAKFDGEYAKSISLIGDIAIILRTFMYLLKSPPVY